MTGYASGYVKGYDLKAISLRVAKKDSFSEVLSTAGVPLAVKEKMPLILKAKGSVYAWYKKKAIVALYFVERVNDYLSAAEEEQNYGEVKKRSWLKRHKSLAGLRVTEAFLSADAAEGREKFEKDVLAEVRERSIFSDDEKAIECNGQLQYAKRLQIRDFSISMYWVYMLLATAIFGMIFSDIGMGICFGIEFGLFFAAYDFRGKSAWEEVPATEENRKMAAESMRQWRG